MAISTTIGTVTTEDAAPTTAPHKVSGKSGKTKLTFKFKVEAGGTIRAWRARFSPTNRNTGQLLDKRGMVCGSGDVCGPNTYSLAVASPIEPTVEMDESAISSNPDGEYTIQVWAMSEGDGWST